jgi:hypothetical protein
MDCRVERHLSEVTRKRSGIGTLVFGGSKKKA